MLPERPASIDAQRQALRDTPCEAPVMYRILVVHGGSHRRQDQAVLQDLAALGHTVFDLDVQRHPQTIDEGPFRHEPVAAVFSRFDPHLVLFGDGLRPSEGTAARLRRDGVVSLSLDHGSADGAPSEDPSGPTLDCGRSLSRADLLRAPLPSPEVLAHVLAGDHDAGAGRALLAAVLGHRGEAALPDEVARRAFARLASHHLHEHRIEALFARLRGSGQLPSRDGSAAGAGRPRTVILSGYYGAANRGDELLLEVLLTHLRRAVPDVYPVVAATDAAEVERVHGVQAFRRGDLTAAESYAARASSVVLGPGGHWHDYSIGKGGGLAGMLRSARVSPAHMAQVPLLVAGYGGSVHVYGMGAGPLVDPAARAAVHLTGQLARSISVRDRESRDLLRPLSASWPAEVVVAPDVVYGLELPSPAPGHRRRAPYLAVNLRPWTDGAAERGQLHRALFDTAAAHGLAVVGVPMQPSDVPELEALAAAAPDGVEVELLGAEAPLPEFLAVLGNAEALVSMRLHASLLMHRMRRPALGLAYDPKVRSHFAQLGREEYALDLDTPPDRLRESLHRLLGDGGLPEPSRGLVADMEAQASRELDRLAHALGAESRRDPDPAWIHHPAARATPRARDGRNAEQWWPAGETQDLERATVTAGNRDAAGRHVEFRRETTPAGDRVALADAAPRHGDYVQWSYALDTVEGQGIRVEVSLRQKYAEKTRFAGYLVYSVEVDGRPLFTHDVTTWNARQSVWIGLRPTGPSTTVTVRLQAARDCADRNWGPSTPLTVERLRVQPWAARQDLVWGSSSPYAVPAGVPEEPAGTPAPARRAGLVRRVARRVRRRFR